MLNNQHQKDNSQPTRDMPADRWPALNANTVIGDFAVGAVASRTIRVRIAVKSIEHLKRPSRMLGHNDQSSCCYYYVRAANPTLIDINFDIYEVIGAPNYHLLKFLRCTVA